jgi:hypothetical protein
MKDVLLSAPSPLSLRARREQDGLTDRSPEGERETRFGLHLNG